MKTKIFSFTFIIKLISLFELTLLFTQCSYEAPVNFPSDKLPKEGADIVVTPTNQPDTVIPNVDWINVPEGTFIMGGPITLDANGNYIPGDLNVKMMLIPNIK